MVAGPIKRRLVYCEMVKCKMRVERVAIASSVLVLFCKLHLLCEMRVERRLRVGNSKARVKAKHKILLDDYKVRLKQLLTNREFCVFCEFARQSNLHE